MQAPQVSSIAFPAALLDLQPWTLMDGDFAIRSPLVRPGMPHIQFLFVRSRVAPRFLQTPPHGDALALCSSFTSIRLDRRLSLPSDRTCWAHNEPASRERAAREGRASGTDGVSP